ncbi:hypothetical protein [Methylogaea oryzae]|uniref:hypothetical protein n=1 Tax=Methylogaea oryzae TaxID=1295382 RepID=UPI0006CF8EF4|nr:hypothetical protein [Methylogaea oryzae]
MLFQLAEASRVAAMVGRMVLASVGQFIFAVDSISPQVKLRSLNWRAHLATLRMDGMKSSADSISGLLTTAGISCLLIIRVVIVRTSEATSVPWGGRRPGGL